MRKEILCCLIGVALFAGCSSKKKQKPDEQFQLQVIEKQEEQKQENTLENEYLTEQENEKQKIKEQTIKAVKAFNAFAKDNAVYFAFDSSKVNNKTILKKYTNKIQELNNLEGVKLSVNGYCDKVGSVEYNNALGLKRAQAVKNVISGVAKGDVKINVVSFGKNKYKVYTKNALKNNRANRKVEIVASAE